MFQVNDDLSIYVTRGDMVFLRIHAERDGKPYTFQPGEVLRFKVFAKKNCEDVVLQKDFPVTAVTQSVDIILDGEDTKIGDVISKPRDCWYEVELNPHDIPITIIGYDEDGARVFKLFPEGADIPAFVPDPEDIKTIDDELDMTSGRPVRNQVIARAFANLQAGYQATHDAVAKMHVTPEMFGAVGDGVADDTEAIYEAIRYASVNNIYKVLFTKLYRVDRTITITGFRQDKDTKPVFLECAEGNPYKCGIVGNTGGEVFRFVNCHHIKLRLNIISSLITHHQFVNNIPDNERKGCSMAYVITRGEVEPSSHTFDIGGYIKLHSNTSLNSGYGTVAIYVDTCEVVNYSSCFIYADTPIIITVKDLLGITNNPYTGSCKDHYFVGHNTLESYGNSNACIVFDGVMNVRGSFYGYCSNGTEESSFIRLAGFLQSAELIVDCEFTGNVIDGVGTISYSSLNITTAGILKGIKGVSLNNVIVHDNMYFKDGSERVIIDNTAIINGCSFYTQYATVDIPRIIINNGTLCNTEIYPANGFTSNTVIVEHGDKAYLTLCNIHEGTTEGYALTRNKRSIGWSYSKPTAERNTGSLFINNSDMFDLYDGQPAFWIRRNGEYVPMCQAGYRTIAVADLATTTPRFKGEFIVDTSNKLHMATGVTAGAWTE